MPIDATEQIRRDMIPAVNAVTRDDKGQERSETDVRADLEAKYGQVWNTSELTQDFDVQGFSAPFIVVIRKSDNVKGSMTFCHSPRYYFDFQPHTG